MAGAFKRTRAGAEPDLAPEQREARIAELRARRRARVRYLAIRGGLFSAALVLALLVFGYWLLTTIGGRELLLAQVVQRLPDNATLSWQRAEGPARGPLTLHGVRFAYTPQCQPDDDACVPAGPIVFTARRAYLDFALRPLLGRRLRLDALQVTDATLQLPESHEPFELPRWPDVLPQIAPPLALQADDVRIDGFKVLLAGKQLIDIRSLRGGLDAQRGHLHVERLVVDSDRGRFTAHGDYAPRDNYHADLRVTAVVPVPNAPRRSPLRLGFVAKGDLARMDVALAGAAPGPLRATLTLRGAQRPRWQLRARGEAIDTALLAGADTPGEPLSLRLDADGIGGDATLRGQFDRGDFSATVLPSKVKLEQQVLEFAPLSLRVFDGQVTVRGRGDFGENRGAARINYAINARGLRWGGATAPPASPTRAPAPPAIVADGAFGLAGTQQAWALIGNAAFVRDGERASVRLDGRGRGQALVIRSLEAQMPTGTLDARGDIAWAPKLRWQLDATLAGFDPGYFAPGWDGAVNGTLATQGVARDVTIAADGSASAGYDATLQLSQLGGKLRGRMLAGNATVKARGERYDGNLALAVGASRIDAQGTFGTTPRLHWDASATLRAFDPGFFVAGWDGAVDGRIASRGNLRADGGIDASLDAPKLGGQLRGRPLSGRANLAIAGDSYSGDVDLAIGGSRIDARGRIADTLDVDARLQPLNLNDLVPDARGTLRGTLRLTGARTAPNIDADLNGAGLAFGELRAATLLAKGRLPWRGSGGALTVRASGLQAGVPFDTLSIDARGAVEALQLGAQARGEIGELALTGNARKTGATWAGTLASLSLAPARGAQWRLQQPAQFRWDGKNGALSNACLAASSGGSLCANADWPRRGLDVRGDGLPLALLVPYLPEREDRRPWLLRGDVGLVAQLRPVGNSWRGQATLTSASGGLRNSERSRSELVRYQGLELRATFDPQRLQAQLGATLFDDGRVDARINTGWDAYSPLSGEIALNTDELTWMELLSPDIVEPTGRLDGRISLAGTRAAPRLGGQARLTRFSTELPALAITLRDGDVRLVAQADGSARINGSVRSGDGTLNVDGTLGWQGTDTPLVLNVRGNNVLVSDTRDLHAVANPDVTVRYSAGQPLQVTGTVTVPEARIDLERLDSGVSASPDVVVLDPADPEDKLATPLDMDLTIALGDEVTLNGFGLDGSLGGRLRVRARPGREMIATGALDIDGRYTAYGQKLDITRGRLVWSNSPVADPILDVRAEREVGEVTAGVDVTGRASSPQARVWSNPSSSQSEALAYLALGRPLSTTSGDESRQLNAASAALSAGGSLLASQLGARIGLDDAGVMESRALGGSVLGIGKYLSPKLYVGYGVSLLGTGQVLTLKYLLRKGFDIEIESSTVENRASINWRKEK
ncbi:translocation/assembly module TamB domain-containing protein [Lysobacter koreensis]|uniref:Translocation/assembly module TamB domain-containing protein n=1 Tax=Lysobacter koreensis TaxID=266122 RepID=A0ABW2YMI5_9GAMM